MWAGAVLGSRLWAGRPSAVYAWYFLLVKLKSSAPFRGWRGTMFARRRLLNVGSILVQEGRLR